MPSGCCAGQHCSCQVVTEGRLSVEGSGQPGDPFVFALEADFDSGYNESFDTLATGAGTVADPWMIETRYAASSKLDHLPDVNAPTPSNGQVLSWSSSTSRWVAAAPTVAATGAVQHDSSLSGDGSAGSVLAVVPASDRLVGSFPTGVGLSDAGLLSVVQHFATAAARTAALPTPVINTLTMLDSDPGVVWYWTGSAWSVLPNQTEWVSSGGSFLTLSGGYIPDSPVAVVIIQLTATTDVSGNFDVLSTADLAGRSGVLAVHLQETGTTAWKAMVNPAVTKVTGTAYRMTDGSIMAGVPVTATIQAILY
jgi:hypothetical protein